MAGITDKEVRALLAKAQQIEKKTTLADGSVPGLTLVAMPTGVGSWRLRYYAGSKQKEVTIGQYPTWGIKDARERAKELRRAVDQGADVALDKQRQKQEALQVAVGEGRSGSMGTAANHSPRCAVSTFILVPRGVSPSAIGQDLYKVGYNLTGIDF